jgi:seryl-tRNA synthetase
VKVIDRVVIREKADLLKKKLAQREIQFDIDEFRKKDEELRTLIAKRDSARNKRKTHSEKISGLLKEGEDAEPLKEEVRKLGGEISSLEDTIKDLQEWELSERLRIPNLQHDSVPDGRDENDNEVIRVDGEKPDFPFEHKDHIDLGLDLGIIDFERAARMTGSRFTLLKGAGARLEWALINYMLDCAREGGYTEVIPPFIVNSKSLTGTGQLPKFENDQFKIAETDYYLIPTAEVPLTNIHREEILRKEDLPVYYVAYTPCFRREAGAAGKDQRGYIRQHQFNKVELVKIVEPERSYEELESLTKDAERVLKGLGLHFRTTLLCAGEISEVSAKTYDLELWLPGQEKYREVSSCSNFESYQARRANIRYRPQQGAKPRFAHTLNGSGVALPRTVVAIIEQYQQEDGSVLIPEALRPYMGGMERITK